jgi:hypothetical protein
LLKGQTSKQPYDLVGELGKAVQAYWTGATLNELPIPLIPSPGATVNISVTSNVVINVGTWSPIQQSAPVQTQPNPIKDDFEKYKESQKTFDEIFKTTIIVYDNRLPTPTQIKQQTLEYRRDLGLDETPGESDTSDENTEETPKRKIDPVKGDKKLFDAVSNGIWPAKGDYGNFVVDIKSTSKQSWYNKGTKSFPLTKVLTTSSEINEYLNKTGGKDVRVWFEVNPEYLSKNCTKIEIPLASGGSSNIVVHKQLKEVVQPAIDKIIKQKLNQYIKSCSGGLAVRNVTDGTRLSNHSWGLAIDMNADIYPIGTKFGEDGIYTKQNKKFVKLRDFNEFDLGFLKVAKIFQNEGLTWLKNFDPMHVSIYE